MQNDFVRRHITGRGFAPRKVRGSAFFPWVALRGSVAVAAPADDSYAREEWRTMAWVWTLLALLLVCATAHGATTQYYYDDLGRVVQAFSSDGSVHQYQYDANGNVIAINRVSASTISIASISPSIGQAGAIVTISGSGFSPTISENTVIFSGLAQAVVTAASPSSLRVMAPQGAVSGPISVRVNDVTATSTMSYIVRKPIITSFAPIAVNSGATVTLVGSNLNLVPGSTSIRVGGLLATLTSISNNQASFIPAASSVHGAIEVTTPYGSATTNTDLVIAPGGMAAANIIATGKLPEGGSGSALNVTAPNKYGVYTFQATAGQYLTVQVTSLTTTPSGGSLSYTLYSPTNVVLASPGNGSVSAAQKSLHLPQIPITGAYLIAFSSASSFQLTAALEKNSRLEANGNLLSASTTTTAHSKRFVFSAEAGQSLGLAITSIAMSPGPGTVSFRVYYPNGNALFGGECYTYKVPGCSWNLSNLSATGVYTIIVTPVSQATMSFGLTLTHAVTGTLAPDTTHNVELTLPGQYAWLTFTTTTTQTFALFMNSIATQPAGSQVYIDIYDASGARIGNMSSTTAATANLRNLVAGTYSVRISAQNAGTASLKVKLASGLTGVLSSDGTSRAFANSAPAQAGYFTFSAAAGENLGLAITDLAMSPSPGTVSFWINKPNGGGLGGWECNTFKVPGCSWSLRNLPATGDYTVGVTPQGQTTMSFKLTLSQNLTATLVPNTPQSVNLAVPGRYALLTFTATAGQSFTLGVSSITATPANKVIYANIYNVSGVQVGSISGTSSATGNLTNLAAGTYSILIYAADAATVTMQVVLQ